MDLALGQYVALLVVTWTGIFTTLCLFDLYREKRSASLNSRFVCLWDLSPAALGGFSYSRLALASLLGLFLELLMIRWISSEIRIFAYFKNFVLIACFLGFGLGCYLCRRRISLLPLVLPPLLFALLIKLPWRGLRDLIANLPIFLGSVSEVHLWGVPSFPLDWSTLGFLGVAVLIIVPLFALLALIFIPAGQLVGWYLENAGDGIRAYSVNVLASLAGILIYTALCFFWQPPAVWFGVAALVLCLLVWRASRLLWACAAGLAVCVALVSIGPGNNAVTHWSPYQKLTLTPLQKNGERIGYQMTTNDTWFQQILDLSPRFVESHPQFFSKVPVEWNAYNLPYHFYREPPSVLVLGAGMGNDVAAALRNGAGRVVAVEIDPLILQLGRDLHFEKPYASARVHQVVDDARSYVQNSKDRFDLILFSLLDSHTTSSHFSNIRIDNYVYTIEALEAARRLLRPDGVFVVKFQVDTPWIAGRLDGLLATVFGHAPLQVQSERAFTSAGRFFITGSQERIARALSNPALAEFVARHRDFEVSRATFTTDDWPYFYQHEPGLPASVIVISTVLIALCWLLMSRTGTGAGSIQWHFFFLGAAFLLLEAQIISKMALLFGTTWVVNSIVISGLLILIVGANLLVGWRRRIPISVAYAGIFVSMAISYSIPLEKFFFESVWLRGATATAVLCLPVFFAGIVFIQSFAQAGFSGQALGSNLFGALVGGLLESFSLWSGLKSLLLIAGLLYAASALALRVKDPAKARDFEAEVALPESRA